MKEPYIVLDIETTGLSKDRHKITEIAAIKIEKQKVQKEFHTLINPQVKISPFITHLTGITDSMVKDSPIIEEIMPKFLKFLNKEPIVAHCASFDYGFLNHNSILHTSKELTNSKICTKKLARRLIPSLPGYSLLRLSEHFKINNEQAHRAMSDVKTTSQVFSELLSILKKKGLEKKEDILSFQDLSISKAYKIF
jgi:DNA polymerase-3 subunit alpha (Gram-positive type)